MLFRHHIMPLGLTVLFLAGCTNQDIGALNSALQGADAQNAVSQGGGSSKQGTAVILGRIVAADSNAQARCPDASVSINGAPATVTQGEQCTFAVTDIQPAGLVEVRVKLASLNLAGSIELDNVLDGDLIEITVRPGVDSLSLTVVRRNAPDSTPTLPTEITDDNISIRLPAGDFTQDLKVSGDKFTLVGVAGANCNDT